MVKIWSVTLRKQYDREDIGEERTLEVVAKNPIEAIRKAVALQKRIAKREMDDRAFRRATSIYLCITESV